MFNDNKNSAQSGSLLDQHCAIAFNQAFAQGTRFLLTQVARKLEENFTAMAEATPEKSMQSDPLQFAQEQMMLKMTADWYGAHHQALSLQDLQTGHNLMPIQPKDMTKPLAEKPFTEEEIQKISEARLQGLKTMAAGTIKNCDALHRQLKRAINYNSTMFITEVSPASQVGHEEFDNKIKEFSDPLHDKLAALYWETHDIVVPPPPKDDNNNVKKRPSPGAPGL